MPERCPECGGRIPTGGLPGLCPRCLLQLGLSAQDADGGSSYPEDGAGLATAGSPAEAVGSAVLTLPAGAIDDAAGRITVGARPEISSETEALLRGRLQVGCWIILVGLLAFVVRDLVSAPALPAGAAEWIARFGARFALVGGYAAMIVLLRRPRRLSLATLRRLEVVILWAVALWFASDRLYWTRVALADRDAAAAMFTVAFSFLTYFAFLSAYGFFAPNTWRRALGMTGLIALLPIGVLGVIAVDDPGAMAFLRGSTDFGIQVSSMVMMLGIGVMIAAWGAHRIHTLRLQVHEARRLGQYRLIERIGRGGMGEVWRAEHRLLARPAAIKLIRVERGGSKDPLVARELARSFEREAQITAGLRSTHTVELYDFGVTDDGVFYYVMELLDGRDLEGLVRQFGPLDPGRVVYLIEQVCDSLAEAHEQGLVHRDVKPANILVCRLGRRFDFVKVLDFGLVEVRAREAGTDAGDGRVRIIGTPSYVAPEMASGAALDARADIYSLGCVAYWLLSGEHVFDGASSSAVVAKHVEEEPVPPSHKTGAAIPAQLERIVMRCLEKDPARRPQSADELADELRATGLATAWDQQRARDWWLQHVP